MSQEIGFVYLRAALMAAGLIVSNYNKHRLQREIEQTKLLLSAYDDAYNMQTSSRSVILSLTHTAIMKWWTSSFFSSEIETARTNVMSMLQRELEKRKVIVIYTHTQNLLVKGLTDNTLDEIRNKFQDEMGLTMYCAEVLTTLVH